MKKIISLLMSAAIVIGMVPAMASAATTGYAGGTGTTSDPYLISTAAQLAYARDEINAGRANDAYFKLTADINFNNNDWEPIGNYNDKTSTGYKFTGSFDGNGHVVKNLKIEQTGTASTDFIYRRIGFFGYTEGAVVKNLGIDNIQITIKSHDYYPNVKDNPDEKYRPSRTAAFASVAGGTFENCYVINSSVRNLQRALSEESVSAFVGDVSYGTKIKNSYAYNVKLCSSYNSWQAGFAATINSNNIKIENCYAADIAVDLTDAGNTDKVSTLYGFGYNRNGGTSLSVVNCYTTVADISGYTNYFSDLTMSSKVSTKAEIVAGLVTNDEDTVYTYDPTGAINGGYPYIEAAFVGEAAAAYAGGYGTEGKPYLIANAAQLKLAQQQINAGVANDAYFKLIADINFKNNDWEPIGNYNDSIGGGYKFTGSFDGNGHVVKNLKIEQTGTASTDFIYRRIGFFGYTEGAEVKNLGIDNIQITIKAHDYYPNVKDNPDEKYRPSRPAAFASVAGGTFENCYVINSSVRNLQRTINENSVSAFVGEVSYGTKIKNSYAYNVKLCSSYYSWQAGFAASINSDNETIENCYAADIAVDLTDAGTSTTVSTLYGFGYNRGGKTTVSVVNCYTTVADIVGNANYESDKTMSSGASDKAAIVAGIVTNDEDTVYTYDPTGVINGGYPYIASDDEPVVTGTGLYVPDTALNIQPVVVYDAGKNAVAVATADKRPSNVIVYVDENLNANAKDGTKIDTLNNYIANTDGKSLALLYISDSADAAALKTWFAGNKVRDITVMVEAENTALLKGIADTYVGVRGAIRYTLEDLDADGNGALSVAERREAVENNNANHAKIVVLDEAVSTTENVRWIQEHGASVWSECSSDAASLHNMIAVAPDGYITTAPAEFIDFVETYYSGNTMIVNHPVSVTGHRGEASSTAGTTENSLSAFLHAWQNGATSVELDVMLTADGVAVISHDDTTERLFSDNLTIANSNWEDLKKLTYKSGVNLEPWDTRMVTLDEVYLFLSGRGDEIEGLDIPEEYLADTGIEICVELKTSGTALYYKVKEVTKKYGMEDRIFFVTFFSSIKTVAEDWPEIRRGLLYDTAADYSVNTIATRAWNYNRDVLIKNAVSYSEMVELTRQLQMRGYPVQAYTTGTASGTYNFVEMGLDAYTTDASTYSSGHLYSISQDDVIIGNNGTVTLDPQVILRKNKYSGTAETDPVYDVFAISDAGEMTKVAANSDGTYTLPEGLATIRYAGKFASGTAYYTYTTPFDVYGKDAYVINGVTVTDNKVTGVTLTEKRDEDATVIVAVFSGNRFKDMRTATAANGLVTVPEVVVSSGDEIRVFVWNSLLSLTPLAEVYTTPVQ